MTAIVARVHPPTDYAFAFAVFRRLEVAVNVSGVDEIAADLLVSVHDFIRAARVDPAAEIRAPQRQN